MTALTILLKPDQIRPGMVLLCEDDHTHTVDDIAHGRWEGIEAYRFAFHDGLWSEYAPDADVIVQLRPDPGAA